jgi:quercetin dioxygenase-like cupin family protein
MMLIREGVMELTIAGKPYRLGPGDVGVIGSNELHSATNVGTTTARYFIVNIGRDDV